MRQELIEKYLDGKKKRDINEASNDNNQGGGNLGFYTFWDKKPMIYVRDGEVLFHNSIEFPTGSPMGEDERRDATARGYIILDW